MNPTTPASDTTMQSLPVVGGDVPFTRRSSFTFVEKAQSEVTSDQEKVVLQDVDPVLSLSKSRKWIITTVACLFTLLVSIAATSYTMGFTSMMHDLDCNRLQAVAGLASYIVAFGVIPIFTSAFTEEFGRQPLYIGSLVIFLSMHVAVALAPNYQLISLFRFIQGSAASSGSTLVAGTVADIWTPQERGFPMTLYSVFAFGGNGVGTLIGGWIEMNPRLQWKWIQWISLIFGGVLTAIFLFVMQETRSTVVARKRAKAAAKKGLSSNVVLPPPMDLRALLWVTLTRPILLFFTEPIVFFISIWIGFAWGVFFCMIASVPLVFTELHGFNIGQVGTANGVPMLLAVFIGYLTNLYQERIYQKQVAKRSVEARLHVCCVAGVLFPASMYMFAWLCRSDIHWVALTIALTIYLWSMFTIYLAVFSYLADCYDTYASSALAGQSLVRNIVGGLFPLFSVSMFERLGYSWANTIFASIGVLMIPIPFTLFFWGSRIRARSTYCIRDDTSLPATSTLSSTTLSEK